MSFEIHVEKRLGDRRITLDHVSDAGLIALFGPSGAGKTSILNMVAGLLRPDRGKIAVAGTTLFDSTEGTEVPPEHRHVGYIFQDARLFPHKRVRANLLYGHALTRQDQRWLTLEEICAFLGIAHLLERWPQTLSGGEAQRVAIGRALLAAPRLLLMDEPLSSLDAARREEILAVIERIRDELRVPIVYVTHDRSEIERLDGELVKVEQ
ncbi:MAG: ATP-binding cassette domain-containing protein [Sphingomonadaceae bacterium]